jgi:hypothetical protein
VNLDEAILLALANADHKLTTAEVTKARLIVQGEDTDFAHGTAATLVALRRLHIDGKVVESHNWKHATVWSLP